jgi:hypothetical protein
MEEMQQHNMSWIEVRKKERKKDKKNCFLMFSNLRIAGPISKESR